MDCGEWRGEVAYPCIVELCLKADVFAFFLILCAQDLQLVGLEGRLDIGGVCRVSAVGESRSRAGAAHRAVMATWRYRVFDVAEVMR